MTRLWLRSAASGLLFAMVSCVSLAATDTTPAPPVVTKPIIGTIIPDLARWGVIEFVNVETFPFDGTPSSVVKRPPLGPTSKTLFQSPEAGPDSELPVGQLIHLEYQPTFNTKTQPPAMPPHFHHFYEWGYTLKGDSIMPEPVSPHHKNGMFYRKKEGGWLSRPPYSLHGGSWATGAMRNQLPYELIIFEEGDGHVINIAENGQKGTYRGRDGKQPADPAYGDWRTVKQFTRPWLVDSVRDLEWEDDPSVPGRFVKWLDDDLQQGFRSQLVKIPPGWKAPPRSKNYFASANRLRYMVWGDMKVWQFKDPADAGQAVKVTPGYFIYQPPRSIWGYGPESVSEKGAIWLEVTYAKGFTRGVGPIEEPKALW